LLLSESLLQAFLQVVKGNLDLQEQLFAGLCRSLDLASKHSFQLS
jgi:hypothetical protein